MPSTQRRNHPNNNNNNNNNNSSSNTKKASSPRRNKQQQQKQRLQESDREKGGMNQQNGNNSNNNNNKRPHNARRRSRKQNASTSPPPPKSGTRRVVAPPTTVVVDTESMIQSQLLDKALEEMGYSDVENITRRVALDNLETLIDKWATDGVKTNPWQRPRVALVTFGSYRLRAERPDSDLDVLALCPPSCTRDDFFASLVEILRRDTRVSQLHPIPFAYTPVIKFVMDGIHVDLVFARVAHPHKLIAYQRRKAPPAVTDGSSPNNTHPSSQPPKGPRLEYMIDDSDLADLDEEGMRSLNGARVSQMLLQMVPHLKNYRTVLRAVKEWAVQAGVYSNVLGFLGGVNWAILVAWVCVRHPAADTPSLLEIFFRTFANWNWPMPVMLRPIQENPPNGALTLPAWNPRTNPRDGLHIMPIITPAYPSMNSSYNVGLPQQRRIQAEMKRALETLRKDKDESGSSTKHSENRFRALFRQSDFFSCHANFLQITIRAGSLQDFLEWHRLVESRLRLLIASLETPQVHAWPFARFFERRYSPQGRLLGPGRSDPNCLHESLFFIGLRFAEGLDSVDLRHLTSDFLHKVNMWNGRNPSMDLSVVHIKRDQLPDFVLKVPEDTYNPADDSLHASSSLDSSDCGRNPKKQRDLLLLEDAATATTEDEDCPSLGGATSSVASTSTVATTASTQTGVLLTGVEDMAPPPSRPPSGLSVPSKKHRKTSQGL